MNKEQAMRYGVREDAYRAFQDHVNRDINKRAREIAERREGGETAFALGMTRDAIKTMIALIDDLPTLQRMLTSVNRTYSDYVYRQQQKAESTTETASGGAAECP